MITITSYPLVQFTNTNTEEGIFTKKTLLFKSFLTNKTNTILVSTKQNKIASFIKPIKQKHNGFLIEMLFHGFNYSAKRLKLFRSKYYIDTHKSEIFICEEPAAITFKSRIHKRRLIFFSYDRYLLFNIGKVIKGFKVPNPYTGKGLFERNDSYTIKQGKKRK